MPESGSPPEAPPKDHHHQKHRLYICYFTIVTLYICRIGSVHRLLGKTLTFILPNREREPRGLFNVIRLCIWTPSTRRLATKRHPDRKLGGDGSLSAARWLEGSPRSGPLGLAATLPHITSHTRVVALESPSSEQPLGHGNS